MIDGLCQRYHVLPSALLAEGADLLRMLNILGLAKDEGEAGGVQRRGRTGMLDGLAAQSKVIHGG